MPRVPAGDTRGLYPLTDYRAMAIRFRPMIEVQGLTKYYGEHAAIRDLSFTIGKGEVIGFLGLNGAGKSTTLRVLGCVLLPTAGKVSIGGLDLATQPHEVRRRIGFLP